MFFALMHKARAISAGLKTSMAVLMALLARFHVLLMRAALLTGGRAAGVGRRRLRGRRLARGSLLGARLTLTSLRVLLVRSALICHGVFSSV